MRYIVFPSHQSEGENRPNLYDIISDSDIDILSGPSESGLYLIEGDPALVEVLKWIAHPYYVVMNDFDLPTIH